MDWQEWVKHSHAAANDKQLLDEMRRQMDWTGSGGDHDKPYHYSLSAWLSGGRLDDLIRLAARYNRGELSEVDLEGEGERGGSNQAG